MLMMEQQTITLIFLIILIIGIGSCFVLLGYHLYKEQKNYRKIIKQQAEKRNGKLSGGLLYSDPKLHFYHGSNKITLDTVSGRYSTTTYVEATLDQHVNKKMVIYKEKYISKIGKILGMQDIELGYPDFDQEIIVKGSDEKFVKKVLTNEIQYLLLKQIKKLEINIIFRNGYLGIYFKDYFRSEEDCDDVFNLCIKLVDNITSFME